MLRNLATPSAGCTIVHSLTSPTYSRSSLLSNTYISNLLGTNYGVGVPEDAISEDMTLGHCWPLKVRSLINFIVLFVTSRAQRFNKSSFLVGYKRYFDYQACYTSIR